MNTRECTWLNEKKLTRFRWSQMIATVLIKYVREIKADINQICVMERDMRIVYFIEVADNLYEWFTS